MAFELTPEETERFLQTKHTWKDVPGIRKSNPLKPGGLSQVCAIDPPGEVYGPSYGIMWVLKCEMKIFALFLWILKLR